MYIQMPIAVLKNANGLKSFKQYLGAVKYSVLIIDISLVVRGEVSLELRGGSQSAKSPVHTPHITDDTLNGKIAAKEKYSHF